MSHWPIAGTFAGSPGLRCGGTVPVWRDHAKGRDRVGMATTAGYRGGGCWAWSGWLRSRRDYEDLSRGWWPWDLCTALVTGDEVVGVILHNDYPDDVGHVVSAGPVPPLAPQLRAAVFD